MIPVSSNYQEVKKHFESTLKELVTAKSFVKPRYLTRLFSSIETLLNTLEGLDLIYNNIPDLVGNGLLSDTPWDDPAKLVPSLVGGTLKAGGKATVMESLSELRMSAIANGLFDDKRCSPASARIFLEDTLVQNLDLVFPDSTEELRSLSEHDRQKITVLFTYLSRQLSFPRIKDKLAEEIEMICVQRPILTQRVRSIIDLISKQLTLSDESAGDRMLRLYIRSVYEPTKTVQEVKKIGEYGHLLASLNQEDWIDEVKSMASIMMETGLCSCYHASLLGKVKDDDEMVSLCLGLNETGKHQLSKHRSLVGKIIDMAVYPETCQCIYGLGRMLERGILDRSPVINGLKQLMDSSILPEVEHEILKSRDGVQGLSARSYLMADVISVLGLPLGVGQGMNPTCQGARGISLWSMIVPGKLLKMISRAVSENNLVFRFEGSMLDSSVLPQGMAASLDYHLDAVSIVLIPHLDKIYFEMMRICGNRSSDPHKWVNPALYGHWIPTGFASAYDPVTRTINNYDAFVRTFYITHHPDYNNGHNLVYPNPLGLFITSSAGALLGFHAITIIRVARVKDGEVRVYFWNPNNEGRQHWGNGVAPTVAGNGERHGESSLPFDQFVSRIYAYHYQTAGLQDLSVVNDQQVNRVIGMARNSWGPSYTWAGFSLS